MDLTSGETFLHIQIGGDTIQTQYRPHISSVHKLFQKNRMEERTRSIPHTNIYFANIIQYIPSKLSEHDSFS